MSCSHLTENFCTSFSIRWQQHTVELLELLAEIYLWLGFSLTQLFGKCVTDFIERHLEPATVHMAYYQHSSYCHCRKTTTVAV